MMRHMKYEYTETDGSASLRDGFIRECPLLDRTYPVLLPWKMGVLMDSSSRKHCVVFNIIVFYLLNPVAWLSPNYLL